MAGFGNRYNSHVQVVWWFDRAEDAEVLIERKPYAKGPEELGVFATRSPMRPNPIAVSSVDIAYVDEEAATLGLYTPTRTPVVRCWI